MKKMNIQAELANLVQAARYGNEKEVARISKYLVTIENRRQEIFRCLGEALSTLRLDIKYLQFDLEATRRERDAYKGAA